MPPRCALALALALLRAVLAQVNVSSYAGGGATLSGKVDGIASAALFNLPSGVALSADTTLLFVADRGNHRIRCVNLATQEVTTVAGGGVSGVRALGHGNQQWHWHSGAL